MRLATILTLVLATSAGADLPERWVATAIDVPDTIDVAVMDMNDAGLVCGRPAMVWNT